MDKITVEQVKKKGWLVFECISGSRAYGLETAESDTDIKGVFVLPEEDYFGLFYTGQVNNESNDVVYYELKRFIELLSRNNPNIMEMLETPADLVLYRHPLMDLIRTGDFVSGLCCETFGQYALSQIRKAKGLNKKILNPVDKAKRSVLDFCYVQEGQGSIPLKTFLKENGLSQEQCGLSKVPHMHETYGLYYTENAHYKGIIQKETSNDVSVSTVPKSEKPLAIMAFNKEGYSSYCKDYLEYWDWVSKRNEQRYANTIEHGKNYDAKNIMHTFRLLDMAEEIGRHGSFHVRRPDRDRLLQIKRGEFLYEDLVNQAEEKINEIKRLFAVSKLPPEPSLIKVNELLVRMRREFYLESNPSPPLI